MSSWSEGIVIFGLVDLVDKDCKHLKSVFEKICGIYKPSEVFVGEAVAYKCLLGMTHNDMEEVIDKNKAGRKFWLATKPQDTPQHMPFITSLPSIPVGVTLSKIDGQFLDVISRQDIGEIKRRYY